MKNKYCPSHLILEAIQRPFPKNAIRSASPTLLSTRPKTKVKSQRNPAGNIQRDYTFKNTADPVQINHHVPAHTRIIYVIWDCILRVFNQDDWNISLKYGSVHQLGGCLQRYRI